MPIFTEAYNRLHVTEKYGSMYVWNNAIEHDQRTLDNRNISTLVSKEVIHKSVQVCTKPARETVTNDDYGWLTKRVSEIHKRTINTCRKLKYTINLIVKKTVSTIKVSINLVRKNHEITKLKRSYVDPVESKTLSYTYDSLELVTDLKEGILQCVPRVLENLFRENVVVKHNIRNPYSVMLRDFHPNLDSSIYQLMMTNIISKNFNYNCFLSFLRLGLLKYLLLNMRTLNQTAKINKLSKSICEYILRFLDVNSLLHSRDINSGIYHTMYSENNVKTLTCILLCYVESIRFHTNSVEICLPCLQHN